MPGRGVADLSYSRADRKENVIETYAGAGVGGFALKVPTGPGFPQIVPTLNYADAATVVLSDPQRDWGHDGLWKKPKAKDEMKSLRFEARRDFAGGAFSGVDMGLNYTTRQKDREMNETAAFLKDAEGVTRAPVVVDADLLRAPTSLAFAGIPGVLAYDVMGALGRYYDIRPQAEDQIINRNWERQARTVTTAYVKARPRFQARRVSTLTRQRSVCSSCTPSRTARTASRAWNPATNDGTTVTARHTATTTRCPA